MNESVKTGKERLSSRMLLLIVLGFSSGLPLLATGSTLQAWMKDDGVALGTIGLYALVGLPYTIKFLWAPLVDGWVPPLFGRAGRRRGWIFLSQILTAFSLAALGLTNPSERPELTALAALLVAFCSATQDIVLDAHRRDILADHELGLGSALFINGYRIGMLAAGALALWLADHIPWSSVYAVLGGLVCLSMVATFLAPEPESAIRRTGSLGLIADPLKEFFGRNGTKGSICILSFILLYKLGDTLASNMTTPFILSLGFSKTELAAIVKTFGLFSLLGGGILGGAVMLRTGINRALWIFGVLQIGSILFFGLLAWVGKDLGFLALAVAVENLSFGMGTSAYSAFMARASSRQFSGTQYALFSSLMGVPRVILASPTGYLADFLGWKLFFVFCALTAIPGMLLLFKVAPWKDSAGSSETPPSPEVRLK